MKGKLYTNPRTQGEVLNVAKTASQLIVTDNKITASVAGVEAYVQSRGQNLVSNGNGLLGTNKNFTGFTFDAQQNYAGGGSFFSAEQNAYKENDELIPVDPNLNYRMSLMAKSKTGLGKYYFGISMFDVDGLSISPSMVFGSTRPVMQLAAELKAGDTTITLTGTDGFEDAYFSESSGHRHSIIFWGYKNSKGYTYPDSTYSRLYGNAMWNDGGINRTTNVITLNKPWTLTNPNDPQGIWRVGQKVSGTKSGGSYQYIAASNENVPLDWKKFEGLIGGPGVGTNNFFPGTAFIKMIFLINRSTSGGVAGDNLWINSVDFANIKAEDNAKVYTNSVITQTKDEINLRVGRALLGQENEESFKIDFKNKISGSTTNNPNFMTTRASNVLLPPSNSSEISDYDKVQSVDGIVRRTPNSTNGYMAQQQFGFDLIKSIENRYGTIKGTTVLEKVAWLKENVTRLRVNYTGYGLSPSVNKVTLKVWAVGQNTWGNFNEGVSVVNGSSPVGISGSLVQSAYNAIDNQGFFYVTAYAEASNGTINSEVNTDFIEIEITFKTNELGKRITSAETNIKQTADKLELTARAVYAQKEYRIRYIRDWLNGSNQNGGNHWVQIQAFKDGVNIALNKPVTGTGPADSGYPYTNITNNNLTSGNYGGNSTNGGLPQSVTVDLGSVVTGIENIKVYHYYSDARSYNGTKTEVSEDGVTWYALFDSAISGKYIETAEGKTIYVNSQEAIRKAESKITQSANKISLVVSDTDTVKGDALVSAINLTNENITIAAEKVNIKGKISFDYFDSTIKKVVSTGESNMLNPNGNFLDWATSYPEGWSAGSTAIPTKVTSDNNTGYAAQYSIAPTQTAAWIIQDIRNTPLYDYVTIEVTFKLVSGTLDGSGVMFRQMGSGGNTVQDYHVNFKQIIGEPVLGKWYTITKILKRTISTDFGKYRIHMMGAWTSFGTPTEKVIQYDSIKTWPSTEAEIKAFESDVLTTAWKTPNTTTIDGGKITTNTIDVGALKAGTIDAGKLTIASATAGITINNAGVVANNTTTGINVTMNSTTGFEIKRSGSTVFTVNTDGTLYAKGLVIDGGTISWGSGTGKVTPPTPAQVGAATPGQVSDAINAVQVGARNIFKMSSFKDKKDGETVALASWGGNVATATFVADTPPNLSGRSLRIATTTEGTGGSYWDTDTFEIESGKTYTVSFYAKASTAGTTNGYIVCLNRISDNNYINGSSINLTTSWQRYSFTFTATSGQAGTYRRRHMVYQVNTYFVANVQLEEGNKMSAWSYNPEEIYSDISNISVGGTNYVPALGGDDYNLNNLYGTDKNYATLVTLAGKKWIQFTGSTMLRIMQILNLEVGADYTWSFNMYTTGTGTTMRTNQWGSGGYNYTNHVIGTASRKITITFKAQTANEILHIGSMNSTDTYYFSDFQLEKGNRYTDYSPAFSQFASFTATNDALSLRVTSQKYSDDRGISGTAGDFKIERTNISTAGWYRFATNAGDRASAKFTLVDVTGGKHATATFYASINYGNFPKVTLINFSRYSSAPFTKVRIVKASTYDPPFLEVYIPSTATLEVYCAENVQSRGWTVVNLTAGSIPSGYTALEFSIDENNIADSTSQNVAKDTANINGQAVGTFAGRVTNTETSITTLNGQIANKVTQTDIDTTLKNIKVGGGNILYNSTGMLTQPISDSPEETETRLRGWELATTAEQVDGRVAFNLSSTGSYVTRRSDFMSLKPNTTYTMTSWAKGTANAKGLRVYVLASNTEKPDTDSTYDTVLLGRSALTNGWTFEEKTFTTAATNVGAFVRIDNMGTNDAAASTVWVSEIQFQEGVKPTTWEPSYKDAMVSVYDLEERVKTAELNITPEKIYSTVSDSADYTKAMQALVSTAQSGMISGVALDGILKGERETTQKAIQAIDFTPYALSSDFEQTRDAFAFNIKSSGGVNLIRNSVGYAGSEEWIFPNPLPTGTSWDVNTGDESVMALGSGAAWELKGIEIQQDINLVPNMDYMVSFLALKSAGKQGFQVLYTLNGTEWTIGAEVLTANEYNWEQFSFLVHSTSAVVGLKLKSLGADTDVMITNLMMNLGTEVFQWQSSPHEIYNTNIKFNRNGIVVKDSETAGETRMTPKEFAGYYPDENGILQPIFQLTAGVTKVQQLEVVGEMKMGDIVVKEIKSATSRGWAFLKNS